MSGLSLSPCPRWSNVTTRCRADERVDVVGEVLLGAAETVDEQQPGERRISHRDGRETHPVVGRHPHQVNLRPDETAGERTRNMRRMAAPETAGAGRVRRPFRLSGAAKLVLRIVVSVALLVLLITKIPADEVQPKDTHTGTLLFLAFGLLFTLGGFVLSAWRWQRVFAVFDRHVPMPTLFGPLPRGPIRGQRTPVDHRWRRPARQSGREDHRHQRHRFRVGGHRATERFRRAPAPVVRRLRARTVAARHRPFLDRGDDRGRHDRRPRGDRAPRRQPEHRRPLRRSQELDPLHRRGPRGHRPDPP